MTVLCELEMGFGPKPMPKGYSYVEDLPGHFHREINKKNPSSNSLFGPAVEAAIEEILKGEHARQATVFVQKQVGSYYNTRAGKFLVDKVASASLNKSVHGAAAISHVSKIIRTHGISNFGIMIYNDGKLLTKYCRGDINGADLGEGLFVEAIGQSGDMFGWMAAASLAASLACPAWGVAVMTFAGATMGRSVGQTFAKWIMGK
jgi:hypothetical protein